MRVEAYWAAVHTGCTYTLVTGGKAFIFIRKTLQVRPRDRAWAAYRPRKLAGQDLRFSMKMILGADPETHVQPVGTVSQHSAVIHGEFTQSEIHPQYHPHYPQIHRPLCSHSALIGISNRFVIPN